MQRKVTVKIPKVIIFIVAFLFIVIISRLSFVSLSTNIDGINLKEFADNRNTKSEIIYAKRGNIYASDGTVLASTGNSYQLVAYLDASRTTDMSKPQHVVDKEKTAKALEDVLGMEYDYALKILSKNAYEVLFGTKGNNLKEADKNKLESLDLPGLEFRSSIKRTYSMGSFASYIIGYAKKNKTGSIVGELGIESYYNEELSGIDGKTTYQTDAYGYTLPSAEVITEDANDGSDIYLTIDKDIQSFAETLTSNLDSKYDMDWMIFTVMDAKTGAIVASSTSPNFNPNKLDISSYMNPLVSYEYEPGSTMKIFSWASSIEEGLYDGTKEFKSGQKEIAGAVIKDFNKQGWGSITYDRGFAYSSNVAATNLALDLKVDKLSKYYKKLGFGSKTGIELANEVKGKIKFLYESELATAAFGQGITVTPIQMLQALSALTNDGMTLKPYVVDKIVNDNDEIIYDGKRTEVEKVYSKETMDYMKKLMHDVVYDGLSSSKVWQPTKTTIIGKTGTAQIASESGGYLKGENDYIRSFAGIFPEEEPKYIVYIAAKQINTSASNIAKEFRIAIDNIVSSLGIETKNDDIEEKIFSLNNYISTEVITTVEELKAKKLNVFVLGSGKYIINQYPLKNTKVQENSKVFLLTNNKEFVMEDVTGWSLNEITTYANLLGLELITNGYGYVTSQSIVSGTNITTGMNLTVTLSKDKT